MNANSKPAAPTNLNDWLTQASKQLADAAVPTARLDAELILAHVLRVDRTWLIAHGDEAFPAAPAAAASSSSEEAFLSPGTAVSRPDSVRTQRSEPAADSDDETAASRQEGTVSEEELAAAGLRQANKLLNQRLQRVPLAYLLGSKEFYGRSFAVTPNALIPRPESEMIIDLLKELVTDEPARLCDVGSGSGCLAITAKLELPQLSVTACDVSPGALEVTQKNTAQLGADITCVQSDLLADVDGSFEYIVANLPYVDRTWERSPETDHEPSLALFADQGGLALIYQLIEQAPAHLTPQGHLLVEADPEQHQAIINFAAQHHFSAIDRKDYAVLLQL